MRANTVSQDTDTLAYVRYCDPSTHISLRVSRERFFTELDVTFVTRKTYAHSPRDQCIPRGSS